MTDQENFQETVAPTAGPAITDSTETQNLNRLAMLHISTPPSPTAVPESTSAAEHRKISSSAKRSSPSTPSSSGRPQHHRVRGHRRFKLPTSATASNNSSSPAGNSGTPEKTENILHAQANCPASAKSTTIASANVLLPPRPISRAATAPSSTFDALLRRKGFDGDTIDQEKLHSAKRLKRMKDRMKEMSQWCEQVLLEGEEDIDKAPKNHGTENDEEVPALPWPLRRASTAPSSTFDTVLREKGFNSASDQDNLDRAMRSKRMKECTREMSQLCGQVICEDEEHCGFEENNNYTCNDHALKSETDEVLASAWYEKAGECVVIQFKCPCEKVYELLLSENHIYYKLMPLQKDESEKEDEEKISVERSDNWLTIMTKCPCGKGYRVLLSGKDCFYKLIE